MQSHQPKTTQIFVRNATVLDCAVLDVINGPRGWSWYVDITWTGQTDAEGILFDFSLAKKTAKRVIDTHFDHRLIAPWSHVKHCTKGTRILLESGYRVNRQEGLFAINTYTEAVAIVDDESCSNVFVNPKAPLLAEAIAQKILDESPRNVSSVKVELRPHELKSEANYFSYTHSLKQHFGNCQRFHGHSNIIEVFREDEALDMDNSRKAAQWLDGAYLVSPEYIQEIPDDILFDELFQNYPNLRMNQTNHTFVLYEGSQGRVAVMIPKNALCLMSEESTIENIADYVRGKLGLPKGFKVLAYEGLAKGAVSQ